MQDHMKEVQNKWDTLKLNDDIWAKLIYFEQNRRLAKAYVSAPVLTVNGSTHGLDGFRIGLSGIDNSYRSLDSIGCLRSIGAGIKLKIDNQGNILIRKLGQPGLANDAGSAAPLQAQTGQPASNNLNCSVWVGDWPSVAQSMAKSNQTGQANLPTSGRRSNKQTPLEPDETIGNCTMREIEHSDVSYKLFDMKKFRLELDRRRLNNERTMDWRQCVSIISFMRANQSMSMQVENNNNANTNQRNSHHNLLQNPCWLMIINIIAIDMLKSLLCDMDDPTSLADFKSSFAGYSRLSQNHSLLHSQRQSGAANHQRPTEPLRTSSSASLLYPNAFTGSFQQSPTLSETNEHPTGSRISSSSSSGNNNSSIHTDNSLAPIERIKKLRTAANNRYRLPPIKDGRYYGHYQSSQQLAANNTIYTTFDGKFINSRPQFDYSSTSDYHSASQSTTSGNNRTRNSYLAPSLYPTDLLKQPPRSVNRPTRQPLPGRSPGSHALLPAGKRLSLSATDLSQRRLDFGFLHTSIKMNFDYPQEKENNFGVFEKLTEDEVTTAQIRPDQRRAPTDGRWTRMDTHSRNSPDEAKSNPIRPKAAADAAGESCIYNCSNTEIELKTNPPPESHAIRRKSNTLQATDTQTQPKDSRAAQKACRSSMDSSSSSSGCIDNDYFLSQSSSSMSSSTASNERELFSQPASSSGIVCSGSTSDEYDENRKASAQIGDRGHDKEKPKSKSKSIDELAGKTDKLDKQTPVGKPLVATSKTTRRGYRIKTIGEPEVCCTRLPGESKLTSDCACPSIEFGCDCCCDCYPIQVEPVGGCDCDAEPIYGLLPAKPSALPMRSTKSSARLDGPLDIPRWTRSQSGLLSSVTFNEGNGDEISVLPMQVDNKKTPKEPKQSLGWLEKRKYTRILPKFIFSSSSSNNSSRRQVADEKWNKLGTQPKSNTLDGRDRFRMTRTSQDLA